MHDCVQKRRSVPLTRTPQCRRASLPSWQSSPSSALEHTHTRSCSSAAAGGGELSASTAIRAACAALSDVDDEFELAAACIGTSLIKPVTSMLRLQQMHRTAEARDRSSRPLVAHSRHATSLQQRSNTGSPNVSIGFQHEAHLWLAGASSRLASLCRAGAPAGSRLSTLRSGCGADSNESPVTWIELSPGPWTPTSKSAARCTAALSTSRPSSEAWVAHARRVEGHRVGPRLEGGDAALRGATAGMGVSSMPAAPGSGARGIGTGWGECINRWRDAGGMEGKGEGRSQQRERPKERGEGKGVAPV
eukprot:scaffold7738_cov107-Isochrysis_galbana.AAC.2